MSSQPGTLTTSNLLSALHNAYQSGSVYSLDSATSVVVNSGNGRGSGQFQGVFDEELGMRAWEHARRRAEDQTIVLAYVDFYTLGTPLALEELQSFHQARK
jgi:chitin synthase